MDLIDLYHAHEYSLSLADKEEEVEVTFSRSTNGQEQGQAKEDVKADNSSKMKKPRFVPWEPYKAAPSADRKGETPKELPKLIPYNTSGREKNEENNNELDKLLVDGRRLKQREALQNGTTMQVHDNKREVELEEELRKTREELEVERKLNQELKKLMVASMAEELQGQVEALTEDKIRLAHRVEEYAEKIMRDVSMVEEVQIERDVWKCKFLAQSIRCDELLQRGDAILRMLTKLQNTLIERKDEINLPLELYSFVQTDLYPLFIRSPCESRIRHPSPRYSNITISCCPNCIGREIYLI
ncbi:hypothetical protein WR25_26679 [Diploscapter pachys]|uniref:Uncharacterized protein n=1 Tax=Diploscapter pachys TaxID=2018661 RepID=A0A2A2J8W6_9BILA|nr:hypothetical protein WR25_26679 [Diploscapter pachys]